MVASAKQQQRGNANLLTYPDDKASGKYDWTSLMGKDVKKLLQELPAKFVHLLSEKKQVKMAQVCILNA